LGEQRGTPQTYDAFLPSFLHHVRAARSRGELPSPQTCHRIGIVSICVRASVRCEKSDRVQEGELSWHDALVKRSVPRRDIVSSPSCCVCALLLVPPPRYICLKFVWGHRSCAHRLTACKADDFPGRLLLCPRFERLFPQACWNSPLRIWCTTMFRRTPLDTAAALLSVNASV